MKVHYFIILAIIASVFAGVIVFAQTEDPFSQIKYPVAELGNCQNREACESYCDLPANMAGCLNFAEEHSLMSEEDIEIGKKMLAAGETAGPGGCRGVAECGTYCDDMSHLKECVAFAEKHDLMSGDELTEAKKVSAALDRGVQPPPCSSKSECDSVCTKPENMKTCIIFAKEAGLMPLEELEEAEKVLAALEKGITPPPCGSKDACDSYCSDPAHLEECITFAEAAGFMSHEEAEMVRLTGGQGPGGCRGEDECEAYCEDPAHGEECINFALQYGLMDPEEAEQAKKMMAAGFTAGPGGCKGQKECEGYCDDITHMTECVDFAEKAGFMSPEDAARARKMAEMGITGGPGGCKGEEECRGFCDDPANMETCINFAVQIGDMTQEEADQARQGLQMREQMMACLPLPCSEALACFQSLSPGGPEGGGEQGLPEEGGENDEIQAKIQSCMQEMMPEGFIPEEFQEQGPSPEEIEKMIKKQMEQEIQRQMQQLMPEQETNALNDFCLQNPTDPLCPGYKQAPISPGYCAENPTDPLCQQSFFEAVKNFLAGLVPVI